MELKEKINKIMYDNGFSSEKKLADALEFNAVVFNRNVNNNKLTSEMIAAFANKADTIKIDFNWLILTKKSKNTLNEPGEDYPSSSLDKLNTALSLLNELKLEMSRS